MLILQARLPVGNEQIKENKETTTVLGRATLASFPPSPTSNLDVVPIPPTHHSEPRQRIHWRVEAIPGTKRQDTRFPSNPSRIRVSFCLLFSFNEGTPKLKKRNRVPWGHVGHNPFLVPHLDKTNHYASSLGLSFKQDSKCKHQARVQRSQNGTQRWPEAADPTWLLQAEEGPLGPNP